LGNRRNIYPRQIEKNIDLDNRRFYPRKEEKIVGQGGLSTTKTKIKIPRNRSIIFEKVNER
jgi:hypothetical protein